jgi:very-short-patch-repair endonuclease
MQSLGSHFVQFHKISKEDYYIKYLTKSFEPHLCEICGTPTRFHNIIVGYGRFCSGVCAGKANRFRSEEDKRKISESTKLAMKRPDVIQRHLTAVRKPKSKETLQKMSDSGKQRFIKNPELKQKIYTLERNKKISQSKLKYWKTRPEEKKRVGTIWKILKEKDENKWRKHLLRASKLGFEKIYGDDGETTLEIKMYSFLQSKNIRFEKQYEIEYKLFDAYLPDYNILLEFDGEFWHKKSLDECDYDFQITSYHNDILKNEIAQRHNIPLFRIRENEPPEKILECLNII